MYNQGHHKQLLKLYIMGLRNLIGRPLVFKKDESVIVNGLSLLYTHNIHTMKTEDGYVYSKMCKYDGKIYSAYYDKDRYFRKLNIYEEHYKSRSYKTEKPCLTHVSITTRCLIGGNLLRTLRYFETVPFESVHNLVKKVFIAQTEGTRIVIVFLRPKGDDRKQIVKKVYLHTANGECFSLENIPTMYYHLLTVWKKL